MKTISILGSTGSIGRQTVDVVQAFPDRFKVAAVAAGSSWEEVAEQIKLLNVPVAAMRDREAAARLREAVGPSVAVLEGDEGLLEIASLTSVDYGGGSRSSVWPGWLPPMAALEAGKDIALVNKEASGGGWGVS